MVILNDLSSKALGTLTQDTHLIRPHFKRFHRQRQKDYNVPNTQTRLRISPGSPMNARYLQNMLHSVRRFCNLEIIRGGDRQLPPDQDPFRRTLSGTDLVVTSYSLHHMTYVILKNIMRGLLDVLIVGKEDYEVTFDVWDESIEIASGRVSMATDGGRESSAITFNNAFSDAIKELFNRTRSQTNTSKRSEDQPKP